MTLQETLNEMSRGRFTVTINGCQAYSDGFRCDIKTKNIYFKNIYLMQDGKIIEQDIEMDGHIIHLDNEYGFEEQKGDGFYEGLEKRFRDYYHGIPHKGDEWEKSDFICKPYKDYKFNGFLNENRRCTARYELEGYVITNILKGNVEWKNPKHSYWKSKKYPKCILKRDWVKSTI